MRTRLTSMKVMKLTKMSATVIAVPETRCKVRTLIPTKTRDWSQPLTTMNDEMLQTGYSHEVTSVHKTMDNSQADLVKVDSDLQLNLDRGSTITAADAVSKDQVTQVHDFGKCEAFDELAKILRTNVDKKNISPELQKLVFDNNNNVNEKNVEFNGECGVLSICEANEAEPMHAKTVKLLPGELNDGLTSILLDTGANVSIITTKLAGRLRLEPIQEYGRQLEVQGTQEGKMSRTTRVKDKVTLGWNTVYEFGFWVMDHSAGSEVVLGTDFMIPAGIRLDLFNATAKLPGEEIVPLVKSLSADEDSAERMHVSGGPTKSLQISAEEWIEFRLQKRKPSKGQPTLVRLMNITDRVVYYPAHLDVIAWVPRGFMPKQAGYVPIDTQKYEQWQVLAYAGLHDETWFKLECEREEKSPDAAVADLEHTFMCVMHVLSTEGNDDPTDDDYAVHEANYITLEDYAQELAFLPDLTEPSVTELDYTAPNVKNSSFVGDQQRRRDDVLNQHQAIMISSGIALPLPAYGMVNAVTAIMEYDMPLVDDLLTELENYLWFCC
ncbi:hypothetical protein PHMEG_00028669 [Phytophthora megakarya]|uniref:Peptidase A2 domain-containing protein n=1 Tax=Phytophthora megakarya TaxID=4795 RepID=A0A225V5E0_9STRA|nr:hypothetical protein PHMEG_00028669 [Phytophthora megakarya]